MELKNELLKFILPLFIVLLLLVLLFFMIQPMSPQEKTAMPKPNAQGEYEIKVRMGSPAEEVYQRNPNLFEESESGVGPGFMRPELSFNQLKKTKIKILAKDFQPVLDFEGGAQDIRLVNSADIPNAGISNFLIRFPIVEGEDEDQVLYGRYRQILNRLKHYGWIPYIPPESARVLGEESWQPDLFNDGYFIDSFEKWKKYASSNRIGAYFYKDNLILILNISDVNSKVEINTAETHYILSRQEDDRFEHWKTYLKQDLVKWKEQRAEEEAKLKAKGVTIAEDYVDAPIPSIEQ